MSSSLKGFVCECSSNSNWKRSVYVVYTYFKKRCRRERRMAVVERKIARPKGTMVSIFGMQKQGVRVALNWYCLTRPLTGNLEIQRSTYLSQTPKNNEASATEFRRVWTKHKVGTIWSRHHGRLFPINVQYPHFFSVVNRRSTIDIRRSPRQHFLKWCIW